MNRILNTFSITFTFCCFAVLSAVSPALAKDYIYVPTSKGIDVIDCDTGALSTPVQYNDYIMSSALSRDGKTLYLNGFETIYVVDTVKDKIVDIHKFSTDLNRVSIFDLALSNDEKKLYLNCSIVKKKNNVPKLNVLPPQIIVYDIEKKKMVKNYPIDYGVYGIQSIRKDSDHLMLFGLDIHKLNLKTGKMKKILGVVHPEAGKEQMNTLFCWDNSSPGDHGLAATMFGTASGLGFLIIDRNTGDLHTIPWKEPIVGMSCAISPDKRYLYTGHDVLVKIDMKTGEMIKKVETQEGSFVPIAQSKDGKRLYLGALGDVSVYDADTLELLSVIELNADASTMHRITK